MKLVGLLLFILVYVSFSTSPIQNTPTIYASIPTYLPFTTYQPPLTHYEHNQPPLTQMNQYQPPLTQIEMMIMTIIPTPTQTHIIYTVIYMTQYEKTEDVLAPFKMRKGRKESHIWRYFERYERKYYIKDDDPAPAKTKMLAKCTLCHAESCCNVPTLCSHIIHGNCGFETAAIEEAKKEKGKRGKKRGLQEMKVNEDNDSKMESEAPTQRTQSPPPQRRRIDNSHNHNHNQSTPG